MIRVLFVCLGNICRSPMAEAVFRHQVKKAGLARCIVIDSAGTGNWHVGHQPHQGTRHLLDHYRISYTGMQARQVTREDFSQFDYIIGMDDQNIMDLEKFQRRENDKKLSVFKLLSLVPQQSIQNVPDPYYTGNFDEVYHLVEHACAVLLEKIKQEHHLHD